MPSSDCPYTEIGKTIKVLSYLRYSRRHGISVFVLITILPDAWIKSLELDMVHSYRGSEVLLLFRVLCPFHISLHSRQSKIVSGTQGSCVVCVFQSQRALLVVHHVRYNIGEIWCGPVPVQFLALDAIFCCRC